ncbi:MAG TPA: energy transducer TonB [Allosphingosinicella sp.]
MGSSISLILAAAAQAAAAPVAAPAPAGHAAWAIDYGVQRCSLIRTVEGADPLTFAVRLIPGHPWPDLLLARADWHGSKIPNAEKVELVLAPAGSTFEAEPITVPLDKSPAGRIIQMSGRSGFLDALAAATRLDVRVRGQVALSIPLPGAGKAVAALHDCDDALVTAWGIDLKAQAALAEPPRPIDFRNWMDDADYPTAAVARKATGTVVARMAVDASGQVTDCVIVAGSGDPDLDGAACHALKRHARFDPAVGTDGRPVAAMTLQTINFVMHGAPVPH